MIIVSFMLMIFLKNLDLLFINENEVRRYMTKINNEIKWCELMPNSNTTCFRSFGGPFMLTDLSSLVVYVNAVIFIVIHLSFNFLFVFYANFMLFYSLYFFSFYIGRLVLNHYGIHVFFVSFFFGYIFSIFV